MNKKPSTMNVKEWIIKKLSQSINYSEKVIGMVITNQFDSANDAVGVHDNVEISGFGKFVFNKKRAGKRMMKYLEERDSLMGRLGGELENRERKILTNRLFVLEINIKVLKPKINEDK